MNARPVEGSSTNESLVAMPDTLETLAGEIESCRRCHLGGVRNRVVVYRGSRDPEVVFLGEAPGAEEDRVGVPFVGRAGKDLDYALAAARIDLGRAGFLNLIKCRPPDNRYDPAAARACRPFLERQIAILRPKTIVPLGAHALHAIAPDAATITKAAGRPMANVTPTVFPLLHPAAPLHNPRLRARFDADVHALGRFLRSHSGQTV
ncbi:MAG: uracil-DNA glycosylase [Thermoplasmata archaeon]|nr:uracil-DNA glycosylase [Thermoplasmata archaeon]